MKFYIPPFLLIKEKKKMTICVLHLEEKVDVSRSYGWVTIISH